MNPKVDEYLGKAGKWRGEIARLRTIILGCGLTEEFKWRSPCYTFQNTNVILLSKFKAYCALTFFKGVLLKDSYGILEQSGENTQSARLIRFTDEGDIIRLEATLKACIADAIEIEKAGLKVHLKKEPEPVPKELRNKFDESPALKTAFETLTPGRQRGYILYFSAPKQSKSRESRIEKYRQRILDGKGMLDCVCGLSGKYPGCDGTHKAIEGEYNLIKAGS